MTNLLTAKIVQESLRNITRCEPIVNEADAHLIAAAPDLYAALETAIYFFDQNGGDEAYTWLPNLKAALNKAKGEL